MAVAATPLEEAPAQSIVMLDLASIVPAKDNPRRDLGDLKELAASMSDVGLLQPLVVTPRLGKNVVVCGHRRYGAAKLAKLAEVPAIVRDLTETQRIKAMLIENCQRTDLMPLEEARAYQQLVDLGLTQRQICADVGKSQGHISKRLALLELTPAAQKELDSGGITLEDASYLLELREMPKRADAALKQGKQWRNIERAVRAEVADHELAKTIGDNNQKLKQDGVKIIEYKRDQWSSLVLPNGVAELVGIGGYVYGGAKLALNPKTHAKEPCHAAAVHPRNGNIVYLCTRAGNHAGSTGAKSRTTEEKASAAKERAEERERALAAREANLELGRRLEKKFAAPKIDARNMRLLADLLFGREAFGDRFGDQVALRGLRYTDEASQTVVTRKDASVSRIVHPNEPHIAGAILDSRLEAAKTPEEIMGVVLQALIAARYADPTAVPPSQRNGHVPAIDGGYDGRRGGPLKQTIEKIAGAITGKP